MNAAPTTDWQTWAALGVVALTVVIFAVAIVRRRKGSKSGCHSDCACTKPKVHSTEPTKPA